MGYQALTTICSISGYQLNMQIKLVPKHHCNIIELAGTLQVLATLFYLINTQQFRIQGSLILKSAFFPTFSYQKSIQFKYSVLVNQQ